MPKKGDVKGRRAVREGAKGGNSKGRRVLRGTREKKPREGASRGECSCSRERNLREGSAKGRRNQGKGARGMVNESKGGGVPRDARGSQGSKGRDGSQGRGNAKGKGTQDESKWQGEGN